MNIVKLAGRFVVPAESVAAEIGYSAGALPDCAKWAGVRLDFIEDDEGAQYLDVEKADRLVAGAKAHMERHYAKWEAYRTYLAEQKKAAQLKREQEWAEDRRAAREESLRRNEEWTKQRAAEVDRELVAQAEAKAEREGRPMSPERFFKTMVSA